MFISSTKKGKNISIKDLVKHNFLESKMASSSNQVENSIDNNNNNNTRCYQQYKRLFAITLHKSSNNDIFCLDFLTSVGTTYVGLREYSIYCNDLLKSENGFLILSYYFNQLYKETNSFSVPGHITTRTYSLMLQKENNNVIFTKKTKNTNKIEIFKMPEAEFYPNLKKYDKLLDVYVNWKVTYQTPSKLMLEAASLIARLLEVEFKKQEGGELRRRFGLQDKDKYVYNEWVFGLLVKPYNLPIHLCPIPELTRVMSDSRSSNFETWFLNVEGRAITHWIMCVFDFHRQNLKRNLNNIVFDPHISIKKYNECKYVIPHMIPYNIVDSVNNTNNTNNANNTNNPNTNHINTISDTIAPSQNELLRNINNNPNDTAFTRRIEIDPNSNLGAQILAQILSEQNNRSEGMDEVDTITIND